MAATVHYSFAPDVAVSNNSGAPFDADAQASYRDGKPDQNPPAQLWERVAESGPRPEPHDLWKEAIERGPRFTRNPRSPLASGVIGPRFTLSDRSGIIHAGERIK